MAVPVHRFISGRPIWSACIDNKEIKNMDELIQMIQRDYPLLKQSNVFTGEMNAFRHLTVQQLFITSDRTKKAEIRPIEKTEAIEMLRTIPSYRYSIQGRPAAGFMADEVPREFTHKQGSAAVDYTSMLAILWTAVRSLDERLEKQKRNNAVCHRRRRSALCRLSRDRNRSGHPVVFMHRCYR